MMEEICMADNYYIKEPLGNLTVDSKIERCWQSFRGKYGLRAIRTIQFDPYASMSSQPIKYMLDEFEIRQELPDASWIENAAEEFIRNEFREAERWPISIPRFPEVEEIEISEHYLEEFLRKSEWENLIKLELPKTDTEIEMAQRIYELLCNSAIGSSKNIDNNNREEFVERIKPLLLKQKRLMFVLPGFPFKDQNRFRVPFKASDVDFCEIAFMIRLHNLIQVLYQIHPYGGQAIVLSDGRLYHDIFHVSIEEVNKYQERLRYYRNKMNFQGDVSIIDLQELIERSNDNHEIDKIYEHITNVLKDINYNRTSSFNQLVQGMKWNMNSIELLKDMDDEEAWHILTFRREDIDDDELLKRWDDYNADAIVAAEKYLTVNLLLKWTDLINKFFPESIRCTVHPKEGQFALSMGYAWNGVAWSEKWPNNITNILSMPFYRLGQHKGMKLVRFKNTNYPCFYTTEQHDQVFDFAGRVLKSDGWNIDDLFGREFSIFDLNELIQLGKDDEFFSWEQKAMSKEYYTTLLQFRINHYKKYGFGVHAIFKNGKLIGQMGLQVLDEQQQQLEYVIFLGKDYTHQGLGTKLLKYLFMR